MRSAIAYGITTGTSTESIQIQPSLLVPFLQQRLNQFLSTKDARVHSSSAHVHYHVVHMCTSHMHMCTFHEHSWTCTLEEHVHFRSAGARFKRLTCTSSVRALFKRERQA